MSPRRSVLFAVVLALTSGVWSRDARAYRPFDQTDAEVAETHDVEIELGPIGYLHEPTGSTFVPGFILNYGVIHRVELVFDAHHAFLFGGPDVAAHRRQLDTGLFGKLVVREGALQDRPGPSIAVEVGALLPTVPLAGGPGMSVTAIASQRWPAFTLHLDAEGDYTRDGTFAFIGGFILEGPDAWAVRPVSEFFVAHQTDAPETVSGLVGAIWRAGPQLSFDSAFRLAYQGSAQELEVRVGLTWSFAI